MAGTASEVENAKKEGFFFKTFSEKKIEDFRSIPLLDASLTEQEHSLRLAFSAAIIAAADVLGISCSLIHKFDITVAHVSFEDVQEDIQEDVLVFDTGLSSSTLLLVSFCS